MAKSSYLGANLSPLISTFAGWLTRTNQLSHDMATTVVTAGNDADGDTTSGNVNIVGMIASNVIVAKEGLRGGNLTNSDDLLITSNVDAQGDVAVAGNVVVAGDQEIAGNLKITGDVEITGNLSLLSGEISISLDESISNTLTVVETANIAEISNRVLFSDGLNVAPATDAIADGDVIRTARGLLINRVGNIGGSGVHAILDTGNLKAGNNIAIADNAPGASPNAVTISVNRVNLDADKLDGQEGAYYQNASNLNAGTVADARLSGNVVLLAGAQTLQSKKFENLVVVGDETSSKIVTFESNDVLTGNTWTLGTDGTAHVDANNQGQHFVLKRRKRTGGEVVALTISRDTGIATFANGVSESSIPSTIVRTDRSILGGNGLSGGGDLAANRTLHVNPGTGLVSNTSGVHVDTTIARSARVITAGNGLIGGGNLSADRTVSVLAGGGMVANASGIHVDTTVARKDIGGKVIATDLPYLFGNTTSIGFSTLPDASIAGSVNNIVMFQNAGPILQGRVGTDVKFSFDKDGKLATGIVPWGRLSEHVYVTGGNGINVAASGTGILSSNVVLDLDLNTDYFAIDGSGRLGVNLTTRNIITAETTQKQYIRGPLDTQRFLKVLDFDSMRLNAGHASEPFEDGAMSYKGLNDMMSRAADRKGHYTTINTSLITRTVDVNVTTIFDVEIYLVCTTSENGYTIGDRIPIDKIGTIGYSISADFRTVDVRVRDPDAINVTKMDAVATVATLNKTRWVIEILWKGFRADGNYLPLS